MPLTAYLCLYFIPSCTLFSSPLFAPCMPPVSIGTLLEPDWNLIGTSLKDDYNISLLSISVLPLFSSFRQLLPHIVAQSSRHIGLSFRVWHALMLARFAQSSPIFRLPFSTTHRVLQYSAGFSTNCCKTFDDRTFRHFLLFLLRILRLFAIRCPARSARNRAKIVVLVN